MRIGQSTDIHQLAKGRDLVLGGVKIPFDKGTLGHSDGDALCHAVGEAVIGALGLGDIGKFFPDNDPQYLGISSLILLERIAKIMRDQGYGIGNIDSLVIIEAPKLAPHLPLMRENLALALGCDIARVNVKATCGEGLGYIGEGKGVQCQAVALLEEKR